MCGLESLALPTSKDQHLHFELPRDYLPVTIQANHSIIMYN